MRSGTVSSPHLDAWTVTNGGSGSSFPAQSHFSRSDLSLVLDASLLSWFRAKFGWLAIKLARNPSQDGDKRAVNLFTSAWFEPSSRLALWALDIRRLTTITASTLEKTTSKPKSYQRKPLLTCATIKRGLIRWFWSTVCIQGSRRKSKQAKCLCWTYWLILCRAFTSLVVVLMSRDNLTSMRSPNARIKLRPIPASLLSVFTRRALRQTAPSCLVSRKELLQA